MQPRSIETLAEQLGGRVEPAGDPVTIGSSVAVDSREVTPGGLFVALTGEQVDGHDFVDQAAERGAAAVLGLRPTALPTVVVPDVVAALGRLGRQVVDETAGLQVVGITGSSGKTSTKDLLAQVLEAAGPCVSPPNSLNTEVGVPLTATRVDPGTRFLVSEMGARGKGHIAYLCTLTPPRVGVVLNVGSAHLGEFGGRDAVATAKRELVESLDADGWAVLNADDERVRAMAGHTRGRIAFVAVGHRPAGGDRQVWAEDVRSTGPGRYAFTLHHAVDGTEQSAAVELTGLGRHQVANATAAAAAACCLRLDLADVAASLTAAGPRSRWRMELSTRRDDVLVLNDAYNANPDSMRAALAAALDLVTAQRRHHPTARLHAVLGDMLELGEEAADAHHELGVATARTGGRLFALGEHADDLVQGYRSATTGDQGATEEAAIEEGAAEAPAGKDEVVALLTERLRPGDVVLVKASRAFQLQTVAEALLAEPVDPQPEQSSTGGTQ